MIVRSLVENLQRLQLDYEDTARAVTHLYEEFDHDEREVQKQTGLSLRRIRDYILIEAQATPRMKSMLKAKKVSEADVKRALRAAHDNPEKAEDLLNLIVKYNPTSHQKKRLILYGEREKNASAEHIIREAMKPHVEESIIISLPEEVRQGLIKATEKMAMEPEELASKILSDWLHAQGFVA